MRMPGRPGTIAENPVREIRETGMRFHGIVSFFHRVEPFPVIEREACAGKVKLLKGSVRTYRSVFLIYLNDSRGYTP